MTTQTDVVIVGAGPCGLFQIFELGLLGLKAHIIDALPKPGGQCTELYPDKPIYDIPAIPICDAQELVDRLLKQIEPFGATFHLDQQVSQVVKHEDDTFTRFDQRRHGAALQSGRRCRRRRRVSADAAARRRRRPARRPAGVLSRQGSARASRQGRGRARRRRFGVRLGAGTRAAREVDDADSPQRQVPRGACVGREDGAAHCGRKNALRRRQRRRLEARRVRPARDRSARAGRVAVASSARAPARVLRPVTRSWGRSPNGDSVSKKTRSRPTRRSSRPACPGSTPSATSRRIPARRS